MEKEFKQRDVSYGELFALDQEFEKQLAESGYVFSDEETKEECRFDFVQQYIDGDDDPQIRIL